MTTNFTFSGYAAVFNNTDMGNDIILPQAFSTTLQQRRPNSVALLWQHNMQQPIGVWQQLHVTTRGLWVQGVLPTQVQQAREAATLMQVGGLTGLSIGFQVIRQRRAQHRGQTVRLIEQLHLVEISLVTFPMNPLARVAPQKQQAMALCYGRPQTFTSFYRKTHS